MPLATGSSGLRVQSSLRGLARSQKSRPRCCLGNGALAAQATAVSLGSALARLRGTFARSYRLRILGPVWLYGLTIRSSGPLRPVAVLSCGGQQRPLNSSVRHQVELTRELSESQYRATFVAPMRDVTQTAEEIIDLWSYADPVLERAFPLAGEWEWRVKHIYESPDGMYQHLFVPVPQNQAYLLIIVNKPQRAIIGHYLLDLAALYGIDA